MIVGNESAVCWWRGVEERGGRGLKNVFRFLKVKMSNFLQPHELYSPPAPSVHGILQTRILEWAAIPVSRGSSRPRDRTWVFHLAGRFFMVWATGEASLQTLETCYVEVTWDLSLLVPENRPWISDYEFSRSRCRPDEGKNCLMLRGIWKRQNGPSEDVVSVPALRYSSLGT